MDSKLENREKIRLEFVKRFLPEGVLSGHGLLFDFQKPCDFRPDANQLKECMDILRYSERYPAMLPEKSEVEGCSVQANLS